MDINKEDPTELLISSLIADETKINEVVKQVKNSFSDEDIMQFTLKFRNSIEYHLLLVDVFKEINESTLQVKGVNFTKDNWKILIKR